MILNIPNKQIQADEIESLFRHKYAQGRGTGFFRELVRYYHWPYQNMQQEGIESGEIHRKLRRLTAQLFRRFATVGYGVGIVDRVVLEWTGGCETPVFLSNLMTECRVLVVKVIYELLFEKKLTEDLLPCYLAACENFFDNVAGVAFQDRTARKKLYSELRKELVLCDFSELFDDELSEEQNLDMLAQHIGTTMFYTGVVQITEYVVHTLTSLVQNPRVGEKLAASLKTYQAGAPSASYLECVMKESLRIFPLFGFTNRQMLGAVDLPRVSLKKDDVVLLDFINCHTEGWTQAHEFIPERWDENEQQVENKKRREYHYMPFGAGPRACPAKEFATEVASALIVNISENFDISLSSSFEHRRSLVLGVPAVFEKCSNRMQMEDNMENSKTELVTRLEETRDVSGQRVVYVKYDLLKLVRDIVMVHKKYGFIDFLWVYPFFISMRMKYVYLFAKLAGKLAKPG